MKYVLNKVNCDSIISLKNIAFLCVVLFTLPTISYSHTHSHSHENPSFKYSREANANIGNIGHSHGDDFGTHGHSHTYVNMSQIWLYSMVSTFLISAAPFLLLFVIPIDNSNERRPRLKVLLAFASGGLLGDAFLHLIPHATNPHHDHSHESGHVHENPHTHLHDHSKDIAIGIWVLCGIIAFLTVEKLVRLLKGDNHGHCHGPTSKKLQEEKQKGNEDQKVKNKKQKETSAKNKEECVEISGYLNLAADFAHNFTDGLAIGASYLAGNSIGIVTTITILLHEVPHEIGDFAILIKSGCSRRKAMLLQLVTAVGALSGNALALIGGNSAGSNTAPWILPFTAGGFIYIATVSVIPELLEGSTKLGQSIKEIAALLTGVALMVFIANFE
ncbi:hypothetical protein DOY81_008164 [Sarcophaga bullata]|nr:hypothetical protein DOY81_008164 [Sarcophaga bullata]